MEKNQVPQDNSSTYGGHNKLLYAVDANGEYDCVRSSGWEAEEQATQSALTQINRQKKEAWLRARKGVTSALEFHMYDRRMDLSLLSQTSGIFKWRIKRHLKPAVFARLKTPLLERYCDALGLDIDTLTSLPETLSE